MRTVRIVIADDHALFRSGLRLLLESMPGVQVVGEAADGHEVLQAVERLHPRVVMMDIAMPGLNGLEATARIARKHPDTRVLVLSMHASEEYALRALRAGAAGYLLKDAGRAELELALAAVARGETYLSPVVSTHVLADYRLRAGDAVDPLSRLTPRQREVLQLVAEGATTKEIAVKLKLSVRTIETHRAELMRRIGADDVAGLVRFAIRVGVITPSA
jgi:DNA-binding NarL/FixJ family response regulator